MTSYSGHLLSNEFLGYYYYLSTINVNQYNEEPIIILKGIINYECFIHSVLH